MNTKQEILNYLNSRHCPYSVINKALLICGDSIDLLKQFPENSIDSCVTDGPYGIGFMGREWDNFRPKALRKTANGYKKGINHHLQTGRSLSMVAGQYDTSRTGAVKYQQWCYEWAQEVYRVLKPGAMLISFCSPRMYHRMATGIEDAGFEIRDQLQYLYGSGFPKSRNISNDIDRYFGKKGKVIEKKKCSRKGIAVAEERSVTAAGCYGEAKEIEICEPCSKEAKQWDGWGTSLKPSNEPILLARKPIAEKSIAHNVLHYGTGGINIDACRIGDNGATKAVVISKEHNDRRLFDGGISNEVSVVPLNKGRFPSNTIIDEVVAELLGDKAQFFYTAKTSLKERNAGCEHLVAKPQNCEGKQRTFNDCCAVCGKKFIGSPETICQCPTGTKKTDKTVYKNKNNHPTVKPVSLMQYLVKLVTPPDGICLDLFTGSGSTGIACSNEGFEFIGIEREAQYYKIAKARIAYWSKQKNVA